MLIRNWSGTDMSCAREGTIEQVHHSGDESFRQGRDYEEKDQQFGKNSHTHAGDYVQRCGTQRRCHTESIWFRN